MTLTKVYGEEWAVKLQERLDHPTNWKEICRVEYTNDRVLHKPYVAVGDEQATGAHTRGTAVSFGNVIETDESITISSSRYVAQFIDAADAAQSTYDRQMDLADYQGTKINEYLESAMLASHASWTDFDNASIGGSAGNITVDISNIDDIIRGIKREIREANGQALFNRYGGFIVWRPADFEKLEAYVQANGFTSADQALTKGTQAGLYYMGMYHYMSNEHTSGHLFAGVRNLFHLGIVRDTYGQIRIDENPAGDSGGTLLGTGVFSRVDFAFKAWTNTKPLLFDVLVA